MSATEGELSDQDAARPENPPIVTPEEPGTPLPAPTRSQGSRVLIARSLVVLLVITALGVGAFMANASLSSTYSPERAVTDYFAAQKKGDVNAMLANATLLKGDGSFNLFFDRTALAAMMGPENAAISDIKVVSTTAVDAATRSVQVTMSWNGQPHSQAYTVRQDPSRVHFYLYHSWRIEIPYTTIQFTLPNQAGQVLLDGTLLPSAALSAGSVQAIQGYHKVSMVASDFYDASSQNVNGVDGNPTAKFPSTISPSAVAAASDSIRQAFKNCDSTKFTGCFDHTYSAPSKPNFIYYFTVPGYGDVNYTKYSYAQTGDPAAEMTLVISKDPGKATASGSCTSTLTVNGSGTYSLKGDWTATLTFSSGSVNTDMTWNCATARA